MTRPSRPLRPAFLLLLAAGCGVLSVTCAGDEDGGVEEIFLPDPPTGLPPVAHPSLAAVDDFCYVLNGPDLAAISDSQYDLVILDYSRDGSEEEAFTAEEIALLKASTGGKVVLAYMSIGEAEDYRFYWELAAGAPGASWEVSPPSWLGPGNPDFPGNYKVRYWEEEWQELIVSNPGGHDVLGDASSYLDRILARGYDGVFLDVIDAFEFFGPPGDGGNGERPSAAADIAAFIGRIAAHARAMDPDFIVCQQNGENLLDPELDQPLDSETVSALLASVDHISLEDVFYQGDEDQNNGFAPQGLRIQNADRYRQQGKLVTVIDYFDALRPGYLAADVEGFFDQASARGWVPYTGPRELDRLVVTPGHEPD